MIGQPTGRGEATILSAPNLEFLTIADCEKVKAVHIETQREALVPKLQWLGVSETPSKWIPWRSSPRFSQLRWLEIVRPLVERFPSDEDFGSLSTSLTTLIINDFPKLRELDGRGLQSLTSLQELCIWNSPELERLPKEGLPPSLGVLFIGGCPKLEERLKQKKGRDWSVIKHLPCVVINGLLFVPHTHGRSVCYDVEASGGFRNLVFISFLPLFQF
uniref:Uncharacterized protein n=1 Tax=Opuntia streptacantha TaxID=393608 RepID=A0A7C9EVE6_OPUST